MLSAFRTAAPLLKVAAMGLLLVTAFLVASPQRTGHSQEGSELEGKETIDFKAERPPSPIPLASARLRAAVEALQKGEQPGPGVDVVGGRVRVEMLHRLGAEEIGEAIREAGGVVEGETQGLAQALVPFGQLVALSRREGVDFIRPPIIANVPVAAPSAPVSGVSPSPAVTGEEVGKTRADVWHASGFFGNGVKVGIVDYFDGTIWNNALAVGEVPPAAGTFCRNNGAGCDIWNAAPGEKHGTGVSEVVHEMAPSAQLYLATANTIADLQAAEDYFDEQGVEIISRSLTSQYDGPGNGTGPVANVIDNAVADGITWFNSAGNTAGGGAWIGQYWRGYWTDVDNDGWIEFAPGDEAMDFYCGFANGLRWSDFGAANPTDYDVYVYDDPGLTTLIGMSIDDQTAGAPPLELDIPCTGGVDYLAINLWNAGNGTGGDVLEFMTNMGALQYWQNPHSASGPASDTASVGALSVGAIDPAMGTSIAPYSSQGPTNDGLYGGVNRIKPDVSAAACVASFTYAPGCFSGTSSSTPAVAGAAALVLDGGLATTPAGVKTYLMGSAVVDRGAVGPDNVFGAGELVLPDPPSVGGIQHLPDRPHVSAAAESTGGPPSRAWAAIAGALVGGMLLGAGGWYARRHLGR